MTDQNIINQALKLSSEKRAELAHLLIDSLQKEEAFASEEAWSKELKRRIEGYEQGERTAKAWSEVKKNAQALLD
ncbi:putative addiction module component, TIGR02574 family [Cyclonatronum proteinivorum]|uniref:Putative addiction module component, TIGR02574 family n=1 Tax=Cyclonatronum proteinivorum TaxID=1457365 RepID=A0A345UJP1_9BACT|nr:addiction module protein [Cyclonatronum proteinivorum]AXJ00693.1 putative addiction module component, TIGR02574 family [Cyclonatronum proteinivorum]